MTLLLGVDDREGEHRYEQVVSIRIGKSGKTDAIPTVQ
jgi:hypothetical protein